MLFNTFVASTLLVAGAHAAAEPAPYKLGSISLNNAFGLIRRQAGYQPTQTFCGPGADCAASCGAGYVQCPSSDSELHCFDPDVKQTCCPDGSGNSCDDGYYCTSDATGGTWCCPDGMDLAACAAAYSLTGSLVSETAAPSSTPSYTASSTPVSVSASVSSSSSSSSSYTPTTTPKATSSAQVKTQSATYTATANGTAATTTSSLPLQITGAANAKVVPGLLILAGALFAL